MALSIGISRLVFQLRTGGDSTSTAFFMPWSDCEYIVTARHCVEPPGCELAIGIDEVWEPLKGQRILPDEDEIDIVAIDVTGLKLSRRSEMQIPEYTCKNVYIGDDCYFLGYPYGIKSVFSFNDSPGAKVSFPLVKRATVSAGIVSPDNKAIGYYMDGHNNPGYSGGPVLKRSTAGDWTVFGVVSSYVPQENVLYDDQQRPRMITNENSGIFICHNIIHITSVLPT